MSAPTKLEEFRSAARLQAALYAVSSAALARQLPEIGESSAAFLIDLARDPTPERCEQALIRLDGIRQHVLKLAEALRREGGPHDPAA